jgi:hypothetical protein
MPAERLTATERDDFIEQVLCLGGARIASLLELEGVKCFSHTGRVRRIEFLNKLRAVKK